MQLQRVVHFAFIGQWVETSDMRAILPAVAAALLAVTAATGLGASEHDRARRAVEAGEALPLAEVLEVIQARHPGRALDADMVEEGGRLVYRIKWLGDDGTVLEISADARTAEILEQR